MTEKNIIKVIQRSITDISLGRVERTFNALVSVGIVGLAIAVILSIIFNDTLYNVIFMSVVWALVSLIYILTLVFRKTKLASNIFAVILIFVFLPVNFFQVGGFFSGAVSMFIFAMTYVCLVIESRIKYFYLAANFVIMFLCCCFQYLHPEYEANFTREMLASDTLISMSVVSILLSVMILFQIKIFKAENELAQKQKKEIEELNLAQNRFFSSMSHEIRTPINTIVGLNEMILREDISEEAAEDAVRMQSAGKMLLSLVNDILDLSKIDAGKMEIVSAPYDTGKMLSEIVNMVWFSTKEKGLEFRLNIDGSIPARLIGDEMRIKQILVNILNNAIKYTPKGRVTLSIQCEKSASDAGAVNMVYSVTDTGIGIKQENIPHLFSVFKRVDIEKTRFIEGTGLGLSIVKQLVDLMGGTIEVNSIYTQGSNFIITIPQAAEGDEELDGTAIEERHGISRGKYAARFEAPKARILVVDDNEANLLVAEKLLRETQAKIDTASSGAECLKKTLQNHYDLIFMDHLMPEMDGIECLREIRKQRDGQNMDTPAVALTANAESDNKMLYRREGFDGYILKPVSGRQLEGELLRHLPHELVNVIAEDEVNEIFESPIHSGGHKAPLMIATDYSADIPHELAKKNGITLLPAAVETDKGEFFDIIEIDQDGIMRYIQDGGKKIASMDHKPEEYSRFFADCLAEAQHVIYISLSAAVVKHFAAASETARSFSSVAVFDSWHLSSGLGLMVLKAAEFARQGMETEEILEELTRLRTRIQTSFVVNDTKYLRDAGRISKTACKICDALLLHPVVVLKKGRMTVSSIKVGTESVFWKKYINWVLQSPASIDKSIVFVTYVGIEEQKLREIEKAIRSKVNFEHIYFQKASASISANCGPGTFGVVFMRKQHIGGGGV